MVHYIIWVKIVKRKTKNKLYKILSFVQFNVKYQIIS